MEYKYVILEKKENISTITLNRPEKLNAMSSEIGQDLRKALHEVDNDPEMRVLIITGKGRAFCAGADYQKSFKTGIEKTKAGEDFTRNLPGGMEFSGFQFERVRMPVIAAINGYALGVGCSLTLHADIRIAADDAQFSFPFSRLGLMLDVGATYYLPRLVGMGKACELAFTARMFDAEEALEIGFVNKVVPRGELMKSAWEMAKTIAQNSPASNRANKKGLYLGMSGSMEQAFVYEELAIQYLGTQPYFEETVNAFLEKKQKDE